MKRGDCLLVILLGLIFRPAVTYAGSVLYATIDAPIFGGFGTNGGAEGCGFGTSGIGADMQPQVNTVTGTCGYSFTTTTGLSSTILLQGAAVATIGSVGAYSSASWTNFGAPDFTGGNWGVTAYSGIGSAAEQYLVYSIINPSPLPATYTLSMAITTDGYFSVDNSSGTILFPWGATVDAGLVGSNCYQSWSTPFGPGSGDYYVPPTTCITGPVSFPLAGCPAGTPYLDCPSMPMVSDLKIDAEVSTDLTGVTTLGPGGTYGAEDQFYSTSAITGIYATVNGVAVDPASLDIVSDAPVDSPAPAWWRSPTPPSRARCGCSAAGCSGWAASGASSFSRDDKPLCKLVAVLRKIRPVSVLPRLG
jgi:hypothetical protein